MYFVLGKEHVLDPGTNASNLSLTSSASNLGSHLSLQSDSSDPMQNGSAGGAIDNPEALEVVKQQKDILEQGIQTLVHANRLFIFFLGGGVL